MELHNELCHALGILIDEHENVEMSSQSNVKSIMAFVEVGESRIFKSTLVSQLNGNPTLFEDRLTWIKAGILYMKPKLLTDTNHDTLLNPSCDFGVCILNKHEARSVKKKNKHVVDPKILLRLRFGLLGVFIRCVE